VVVRIANANKSATPDHCRDTNEQCDEHGRGVGFVLLSSEVNDLTRDPLERGRV
jgi:hypothetical protein